jgi:hypothetical protein
VRFDQAASDDDHDDDDGIYVSFLLFEILRHFITESFDAMAQLSA